MSTTYKEVHTLNVTLKDSLDHQETYKIDNPKNNVTMTQVNAAWANVIDAANNHSHKALLYGRNGYPFTEVVTAQKKIVVTTLEDLPE